MYCTKNALTAANPPRLGNVDDAAAGGIGRATVELGAVLLAGAENHAPAAVRTARRIAFTHRRMTLLQIGDVVLDLTFAQRPLPFAYGRGNLVELLLLDDRTVDGTDVVGHIPRIDHAVGHVSLERAVSGESHDADKIRLVNSEIVCECADVLVVLPHRILEPALLMVDGLRPLLALLVAEYPAGVCLRLDDENAVLRNDDVVNLRRRPVRQRQVDVVQNPVLVG